MKFKVIKGKYINSVKIVINNVSLTLVCRHNVIFFPNEYFILTLWIFVNYYTNLFSEF